MRHAHILKPNKNSETPQRACWVKLDIIRKVRRNAKTDLSFKFGILLHGVRNSKDGKWLVQYHRFTDAHGFWQLLGILAVDKTRLYVIVEDSGQTLALLDAFTISYKLGWTCTKAIISCPPLIVRWRRDRTTLQFLDVANFSQSPLTTTSNGKSAQHGVSDTELGSPEKPDARIKRELLTMHSLSVQWWGFLKTNDLGGFAATIASQALRTFRHKFMSHEILIDTNTQALELARKAYVGARTECFFIGRTHGEYYLLDVNSMYAAVMRDMDVPIRLRGYTEHATINDLHCWFNPSVVIADVDIETDENCYPLHIGDKLVFPVGRFRTVLSGNEVWHAVSNGHVRAVHRCAIYEKAPAFKAFVEAMWSQRALAMSEGRMADEARYKLILASFYGKWGQGGGHWDKTEDADSAEIKSWISIDYDSKDVTEYRQFGGIVQAKGKEAESADSHPAIAACITANARMMLHGLIMEAGSENVFYVDTDSLVVNNEGLEGLSAHIIPQELGKLRLEGVYNDLQIHTSKDYVFDGRVRRKGIRTEAVDAGDGHFWQDQQRGLAAMIRTGDMSKAGSRRVRKTLIRKYDKGVQMLNGRIKPICLK